jgi:hypothetical protein
MNKMLFKQPLAFLILTLPSSSLLAAAETAVAAPLCRIEVVEKGSGWPVPLVELRTDAPCAAGHRQWPA